MNAPLYNALCALADKKTARFHMPGHKGQDILPEFGPLYRLDFTEVYETGNLYTGEGPIRLAEREAARLYQAADCHFLTGGSSQGVHAMLYAAAGAGADVLLDRNCHKSAAHAAALLDLSVAFVFPAVLEPFGVPGMLNPDDIDRALGQNPAIRAVLITSPNYYGVRQDIPAIAAVCHAHGARLLVDAAHGAHFPGIGLPSPIAEGADLAAVSTHKTLYAPGQTAMLLSNGTVDSGLLREGAALFGTSSPSYLLLAGLDLARAALEADDRYAQAAAAVSALRGSLAARTPFLPLSGPPLDPCRLTLSAAGTDWTGHRLADTLYEQFGVACEMSDARNIVCIVTPADLPGNLTRLENALLALSDAVGRAALPPALPPLPLPRTVMPVRRALLGPGRALPLDSVRPGMVCARPVTPYPPGVPVLWPGEEITPEHIVFLHDQCYNTIDRIAVCPSKF